jgi:hypothetical protein
MATQEDHSRIAFTICTANHLPRALTLAGSLARHASDYQFFLVLIDPLPPGVNRAVTAGQRIVTIDDLNTELLKTLRARYDPAEISFCLKPVVFDYLFKRFPRSRVAVYFDSDVMVYHSFRRIEAFLNTRDLVLTPHLLRPQGFDGKIPDEFGTLRTGYFNMGFAAMANRPSTMRLLKWWRERMVHHGHANRPLGLSADQFWMTFAPYYFDNITIDRHPGMNVAYWNLHERNLSKSKDMILVNGEHPLIFVHFSGFDPQDPHYISDPLNFNRFRGTEQPVFSELSRQYAERLLLNHYSELNGISSDWLSKPDLLRAKFRKERSLTAKAEYALIHLLARMPVGLRRRLWRLALLFISQTKY